MPSRHVDGLAEEEQRRRRRLPPHGAGGTTAAETLVAVNGEEREREGQRQVRLRAAEPVQRRAEAEAVQPAVPAERSHDGARGGARCRRRADVAEAERLPDGVAARDGGPQAAHARGRGERAAIQAREDLGEQVGVVVDVVRAAQLHHPRIRRPPHHHLRQLRTAARS
jgi:hypothetical protein